MLVLFIFALVVEVAIDDVFLQNLEDEMLVRARKQVDISFHRVEVFTFEQFTYFDSSLGLVESDLRPFFLHFQKDGLNFIIVLAIALFQNKATDVAFELIVLDIFAVILG